MPVTDWSRRVETLSPQKRALLERALQRKREEASGLTPIQPRVDSGPAPLSFPQQRIWFLEQWEPGGFTHNGARAFRLRGSLDVPALERALTQFVSRHEILRTIYVLQGREPKQVPLSSWELRMPVVDLSALPEQERQEAVRRQMRELSREPFDLKSDLMLRATLFRFGPDDHILLVRLHHISFDAFSDRVLSRELGVIYRALVAGGDPELPELPIQYADYAVWQRGYLTGRRLDDLVSYWRSQLHGAPPFLRLPTDGARQTPQRHEGRHVPLSLPGDLITPLVEVGRAAGATVYMTLLSAFAVLLYRVSGQDDVVVGTPIANRGRAELEELVGFFSNTLALRNRLGGNPTFREVLGRTRKTAVEGYAHQELPFERIVEELNVPRDASYNPIFQVNFRAQTEERGQLRLPGVDAEPISIDIGFSRFDLALELQLERDRIGGYLEYDLDLFAESTIESLVEELETSLEQLVREPDRPILELRLSDRWRRRGTTRTTGIRRLRKNGEPTPISKGDL
jgi:condensation domain-containing protein